MKKYISESRAVYEDNYHGQFSKKLATWAISKMELRDNTGKLVKLVPTHIDEVVQKIKANGTQLKDEYKYTVWYLYNMARADYQKALPTDAHRIAFVVETLFDPDCCPEAVLECFTAKMCTMGVPIMWEDML